MKKSWLRSNSVCLAMGDAVALNLMFETKKDHELFFKYWKKYLGDMASLINYHLTPTGWILLFKTKNADDIKSAYLKLRKQSKKAKKENTHKEVSKILSEHFRIFLSQFVRRSNAYHGRKGTKVLQSFHRYVFKDSVDYEHFFNMITRQQRKQPQKENKYHADEANYDLKKEIKRDSIWKVGSLLYKGLERKFRLKYGVILIKPDNPVLRKYLNQTKNGESNTRFT